jgi:creatinine amidohydrolase/Fe(II)-dependent formamide hydrolase-like protein
MKRPLVGVLSLLLATSTTSAQVVQLGDLNTRQIQALDRAKAIVLLQGGMLEEHGPYLPAFADGILSERLTREIASGVVAKKPGWTALVLPPVPVGASGSNEIGKQFVFPGTYAVRPSTSARSMTPAISSARRTAARWPTCGDCCPCYAVAPSAEPRRQ